MTTDKKQEVHTHKLGIYLWIWGLLFVFSFFSYMVDYLNFQGLLRWSLIIFFMLAKAGFIMANDSHWSFHSNYGGGITLYIFH